MDNRQLDSKGRSDHPDRNKIAATADPMSEIFLTMSVVLNGYQDVEKLVSR